MTIAEARANVELAAALLASAARGVDAAQFHQRFGKFLDTLDVLIAATRSAQIKDCLASMATDRSGHA